MSSWCKEVTQNTCQHNREFHWGGKCKVFDWLNQSPVRISPAQEENKGGNRLRTNNNWNKLQYSTVWKMQPFGDKMQPECHQGSYSKQWIRNHIIQPNVKCWLIHIRARFQYFCLSTMPCGVTHSLNNPSKPPKLWLITQLPAHAFTHTHLPTRGYPHSFTHMQVPTRIYPPAVTHTHLPTRIYPHAVTHMHLPTRIYPHAGTHTSFNCWWKGNPKILHPHRPFMAWIAQPGCRVCFSEALSQHNRSHEWSKCTVIGPVMRAQC